MKSNECISTIEFQPNAVQNVIVKVNVILNKIIDENHPNDNEEFKVRPDYGYAKFYLTWVDGCYDMSLQSLIHYILFEEKLYDEFLSSSQLEDVKEAIKECPEEIYYPDTFNYDDKNYDNNLETEDKLDEIYTGTIIFAGNKLRALGYDVHNFISLGYLNNK